MSNKKKYEGEKEMAESRKMKTEKGLALVPGANPLADGCNFAVEGRLTPKFAYTLCVNPEQSAPPVRLVPPHTYGLPTNCVAKSTTEDPDPEPEDEELSESDDCSLS